MDTGRFEDVPFSRRAPLAVKAVTKEDRKTRRWLLSSLPTDRPTDSLAERNVSNNFVREVVVRYIVHLSDSIELPPIKNDITMECGVKV